MRQEGVVLPPCEVGLDEAFQAEPVSLDGSAFCSYTLARWGHSRELYADLYASE